MSPRRHYQAGAAFLVAGTWLHPASADPNDPAAAFAEYAATGRDEWVGAHLIQFAGLAAMILAIIVFSVVIGAAVSAGPVRMTAVCGAAALAATLQAVDGIALKATVDLWSGAGAADRPALVGAAFAVRQVEIGLDALFALVFGATILCLAVGVRSGPAAGPR